MREKLEERVAALNDQDPKMGAELEDWGRRTLAPQIQSWRSQDLRKHKEKVANTTALRLKQLNRDMAASNAAVFIGETEAERLSATARLEDGRKETLQLFQGDGRRDRVRSRRRDGGRDRGGVDERHRQ